jgi:general secretion pathway protein A
MDKACEAFSPAHMQFYNFSRNPFGIAPDPSLLSLTSSHWAALVAVYSGILQHQSVLLMTGDPGSGKSLVVASLMELLKSHHIQAKYVTGPKLCSSAAVTSAGGRLGSIAPCQTRDARAEFEPDFDQERGQQLGVLFVDEAQDPSINVLREIQLLATPNNPQHRKIQIVIVGRPEVDQILNSHEFHQLKALIAIHHHLRPIQEAETEKYIACRVLAVQKDSESGPVFREDALAALCGHSRGNPRLLNFLCEAALIKGHAQRQRNITAAIIEEVAKRAPSDVSPQERIPYTNGKDATELLKAAGVMLDLHLALRRVRTEERHWMSLSTQPICS